MIDEFDEGRDVGQRVATQQAGQDLRGNQLIGFVLRPDFFELPVIARSQESKWRDDGARVTPVTTSNCGGRPARSTPRRTPAPNAPSLPPPESASVSTTGRPSRNLSVLRETRQVCPVAVDVGFEVGWEFIPPDADPRQTGDDCSLSKGGVGNTLAGHDAGAAAHGQRKRCEQQSPQHPRMPTHRPPTPLTTDEFGLTVRNMPFKCGQEISTIARLFCD